MNDEPKSYKIILYDHLDTRYLIRISDVEINRALMGSFDRIIVYDMLDGQEKALAHVLAYVILSKGEVLDG
jgi:hypothetical protein